MADKNLWMPHASALAEAYSRSASDVRFEIVTRYLLEHLPPAPLRVIDIGGGYGRQAILLARRGHSVVVVDLDEKMLALARDRLADEPPDVASRVELILSDGESAATSPGNQDFDLACCHSVLMYLEDPRPILAALTATVRPGGLLSVLSVNPECGAMRSGLQGRWREARALLEGRRATKRYLETADHTRQEVADILEENGARVMGWQGIGVFTDHLAETIRVDDPEDVYTVEWLASIRDPYRLVASSFHLLARRM